MTRVYNIAVFIWCCLSATVLLSLSIVQTAVAQEQALTIDLVQESVDITAGFSGATLDLYGVSTVAGDIAIVITGPEVEMVVRHKEEMLGVWANSESVKFENVPAYYDLALSIPARDIATAEIIDRLNIGLNALNFIHTGREGPEEVKRFREALIRNKQTEGYYPLAPEPVTFLKDNFFRTAFYLPPDVPTGTYTIRSYLFRDGEILDQDTQDLTVAQVGFGARLNYFAYVYAWAYGALAIIFGIMAGWLAYVFLRKK